MNDWETLKDAIFVALSVFIIVYGTISVLNIIDKRKEKKKSILQKQDREVIKQIEENISKEEPVEKELVIDPQGYELMELMREIGAEQYIYCKDRECDAEHCAVIRMIGEAFSMTPICGLAYTTFRFDCMEDIKDLVSSYRAHCSKYNGCRGCSTKKFRKTYGEKGEFLECYLIYSVLYLHNRLDLLGDDQNGWSIPDRINM